jgi:hypothetical protein
MMLLAGVGLAIAVPQLGAGQPRTAVADWANAPLSPGGWVYRAGGNARSRATFGPRNAPAFEIACTNAGGIALFRHGARAGSITVRTSATLKQMTGNALAAGLSVPTPATDPILDAMAFSRGRFGVEAPGVANLVVPAWPELARVIEDCRRG